MRAGSTPDTGANPTLVGRSLTEIRSAPNLSVPMEASAPAAASNRIDAYVWRVSGVVLIGSVMSILDTTIVNVALHTLSRDLHAAISSIQWVVTGYLLSLAAVIPITGW